MRVPDTPAMKRQLAQPWSVGRVCVVHACTRTLLHTQTHTRELSLSFSADCVLELCPTVQTCHVTGPETVTSESI